MSLNRLRALANMKEHINILLAETPHPSKEWDTLISIIDQLSDYAYWVAVSVEGVDTKKRHMAFFNIGDEE